MDSILKVLDEAFECMCWEVKRFKYEVNFAVRLTNAFPEKKDEWDYLIREATCLVAQNFGKKDIKSVIEEAEKMLDEMDRKLVAKLGNSVFGRDEETLEQVVVKLLIERGLTLGIAESCTGGLIANRITDVPGCSATFLAGVVSYSNKAKQDILGVPEHLLIEHGAVSEEVARAMAEGIRKVARTDIGISVTGIAGPSGGTPEKPVGLVYMALASEKETVAYRHRFMGSRKDIKWRSSQAALDMLRLSLI